MIQKLLTLNYQRNGVAGEGFFVATVKNLKDTKGVFLITFDTDDKDDTINHSTCRCVMLDGAKNPFYTCWRGDTISGDLQDLIRAECVKNKVKDMYDLHTHLENKVTGHNLPVKYLEK